MLELADIALSIGYLLIVFAAALLGGFLANMFYGFYGYSNLAGRLLSLENSIRGAKGVEARQGKEERMGLAIAEGAAMMKKGKNPVDIIRELGPKYPDIALDLYKKFKKGGLEGLL